MSNPANPASQKRNRADWVDSCGSLQRYRVWKKKAHKLREVTENTEKPGIQAPVSASVIVAALEMLDTLLLNILKIEQEIRNLVKQETYIKDNLALLQSIPGTGSHSSAWSFSPRMEIFPCFKSQSNWVLLRIKNKLSKRGSAFVRSALHMAAVTSVIPQKHRPVANPVLHTYYENKCVAKPGKVAMCAVMHKICNIIFAVFRDQKPFELRLPEQHAQKLKLSKAA